MKQIVVNGSVEPTLVDDDDFARLASITWRLMRKKSGAVYVVNDFRDGGKTRKRLMHRVVMDAPDGMQVDHRNRNGLDNQKRNLRFATGAENSMNRPGLRARTSSYKGVSWDSARGKWRAQLCCDGRRYRIGRFDTEVDAAIAYDCGVLRLCPSFAFTNILKGPKRYRSTPGR